MISHNNFCVYKHIRLDNNTVFYVGRGKNKRPYSTHNRNIHWHNIVNKCGFKVEIIGSDLSFDDANKLEKKHIKKYGRLDLNKGLLINLTNGGDGKDEYIMSEETKNKLKGKIRSLEYKKNLSKKAIERFKDKNNHPSTNKPRSKETKEKLSNIGKNNIGELNGFFGKKHSKESLIKIGEKSIGRQSFLGHKHNEITKQKMCDAWLKRKEKSQ